VFGLWALSQVVGACEGLTVHEGWVRAGPPNAAVLAGFGELGNTASGTLQITALGSAGFRHVMLHETVIREGQARMIARDSLRIDAGEQVTLAPGGLHLMLMHAKSPVVEGQTIAIDFVCGNTRSTLQFPVRRDAP